MSKKIFGWVLLIVGILLIFNALYSSFGIFTAQKEPPTLFEKPEEVETTETTTGATPTEIAQQEMQKIIQEQLKSMLPSDSIFKMLNLIVWTFWAGLLIFGGSKISSLGIKLLKQ